MGICWWWGWRSAAIRRQGDAASDRTFDPGKGCGAEVKAIKRCGARLRRASESLQDAHTRISADRDAAVAFLRKQGFAETEIERQPTRTVDKLAREYGQPQAADRFRYVVTTSVVVKTANVDLVRTAVGATEELLRAGVILDGEREGAANPRYVVSKFNDLRPQLLADATKNARATAQQFAADSGAQVGVIRSANQGSIQIFGMDGNDESGPFSPTSTLMSASAWSAPSSSSSVGGVRPSLARGGPARAGTGPGAPPFRAAARAGVGPRFCRTWTSYVLPRDSLLGRPGHRASATPAFAALVGLAGGRATAPRGRRRRRLSLPPRRHRSHGSWTLHQRRLGVAFLCPGRGRATGARPAVVEASPISFPLPSWRGLAVLSAGAPSGRPPPSGCWSLSCRVASRAWRGKGLSGEYWAACADGEVSSWPCSITEAEVLDFALKYDPRPFHTDPEAGMPAEHPSAVSSRAGGTTDGAPL